MLIDTPFVYLRWKENKQLIEFRNNLLKNLVKNQFVNKNSNSDWIAKTTLCFKDLRYENNFTNTIFTIKEMFTKDFNEEFERLVLIRYLDSEKEKVIEEFTLKND